MGNGERGSADGEELIGGGSDGQYDQNAANDVGNYCGCLSDLSCILWLIGGSRCLRFDGPTCSVTGDSDDGRNSGGKVAQTAVEGGCCSTDFVSLVFEFSLKGKNEKGLMDEERKESDFRLGLVEKPGPAQA